MTTNPADLPDDAPIELNDIDDGWFHAKILDWIILHPEIDHTAYRVYSVFVSLATRQSQFRRRLTKDQVRYLVPGVNGKTMKKTAFKEALNTLSEHGLVVIEHGTTRNESVRDVKSGQWKPDESMRFRVNQYPTDKDGFAGWRNAAQKLDAYPGTNWETVPTEPRGQSDPRQPDPPKEVTHNKFVYIIGEPDQVTVKIGIADDVDARLKQLQTSAARPLSVLWAGHGDQTVEERLHRRYHKYRLSGEWFRFKQPHQIQQVARMAVELGAIEIGKDLPDHRGRNSGHGPDAGDDQGNVDNCPGRNSDEGPDDHRGRNSDHPSRNSDGDKSVTSTDPTHDYSPSITGVGNGESSPPPYGGDAGAREADGLASDRHVGEPDQPSNEGEGGTPNEEQPEDELARKRAKDRVGTFIANTVMPKVPRELSETLTAEERHRIWELATEAHLLRVPNATVLEQLTNVSGTRYLGRAWEQKLTTLIEQAQAEADQQAARKRSRPACTRCGAREGAGPHERTVLTDPNDPHAADQPCPNCHPDASEACEAS